MSNEWLFFLHVLASLILFFGFVSQGKGGLVAWITLQIICANFFVLKQITLGGYTLTCSDVFAVGCSLGLNWLQELYGGDAAKKTLLTGFLAFIYVVAMSQFHLAYQPAQADNTQAAYALLLRQSPRILIASVFSFFISQRLDLKIFGWISRYSQYPLTWRSGFSTSITQTVDTILFSVLALYGVFDELYPIILFSLLNKLFVVFLLFPVARSMNMMILWIKSFKKTARVS